MRKGRVRIGKKLIADALNFPPDWEIESMSYKNCDPFIMAVIIGSDFPETTEIVGEEISECKIICHKETTKLEVKELC